jgi:hypothetical protein
VVTRSSVRDTLPQPDTGLFGDNLSVASMIGQAEVATLEVSESTIAAGPRAGVASFGGAVTLRANDFECNGFDLNGQDTTVAPFAFADQGGNVCGCDGVTRACVVSTEALEPPSTLGP